MELTQSDKQLLLTISRNALEHIFETGHEIDTSAIRIPKKQVPQLNQKAATFVTLTKEGQLRGCIGKVTATKPLYIDVIENTYKAAFGDPRFPQLDPKELDKIKIEISVLSPPEELREKKMENILGILAENKPGVILQLDLFNNATFLPQVWEQVDTAEDFMKQLSVKAGLTPEAWKSPKTKILTYTVTNFEEKKLL